MDIIKHEKKEQIIIHNERTTSHTYHTHTVTGIEGM